MATSVRTKRTPTPHRCTHAPRVTTEPRYIRTARSRDSTGFILGARTVWPSCMRTRTFREPVPRVGRTSLRCSLAADLRQRAFQGCGGCTTALAQAVALD